MTTYKLTAIHPGNRERSEFHGFKFEAENYQDAGKVFAGLSGMYGRPADEDYEIHEHTGRPGPKQRYTHVLPSLRVSKELYDRLPKEGLADFRRKALEDALFKYKEPRP